MCGIAGVFGIERPIGPDLKVAVRSMTGAIRHRGPDGDGFYDDRFVSLGHRRLAIIDVAGGDQPIANEDETVWVVFNGEIYNYRPLRSELIQRGHQFRTNSDTETIVHAYEEFGTECLARLDGMFAFAVYDSRNRHLFVARDRLGKKPLFFAELDGVFHFASELHALRHSPLWVDTEDPGWLEEYLAFGYIVAPRTVYQHARKLQPGHFAVVSPEGLEIQKYWDVQEFDTDRRPESDVLEDLDQLLNSAVTSRLESEVPLGAFLSGGIDSGLVVSYMAQAGPTPTTVSVGFDDTHHNELAAAQITATALRTNHHPHLLTPRLDDLVERMQLAFGEPFADPSAVPTFFVSQAARAHVTVALSGDGGDEAFAGYDFRYVPHAVEALARQFVPDSLRGSVRAAAGYWPSSARLPRPLRLRTVIDNVSRNAADAYFADLCFIRPLDCAALLGRDPKADYRSFAPYSVATDPYLACSSSSPVQKAEYADLKIYLANGPLVKVDRMSMLNSLEVRSPLLDRRIIEFAFRLPTKRKMPNFRGKRLLRQLARRRLPAEIVNLPKRGFSAPAGRWILGPLAEQFNAFVLDRNSRLGGTIDSKVARRYLVEHAAGHADRSYALWSLWMAGSWMATQGSVLPAAITTR